MAQAEPATIAHKINQEVEQRTLSMRRYASNDDFELKRIERDIDKLQNADAFTAFILKAYVAHMRGDPDGVDSHIANAEKLLPTSVEVVAARLICYTNLGFASKALVYFQQAVDIKHGNLGRSAFIGIGAGAFQRILTLINQAKAANLELPFPSEMELAQHAASLLSDLKITDEQCAAVIDAAGEVLRSRKLFWLDRAPSLAIHKVNETISLRMKVDTSYAEASAMTLETIDKLIERDLDRLPFYVSFQGTSS